MLVVIRDDKGNETQVGQFLANAGLDFLPDSFNVDDGLVSRGEQQALIDHPQLDNIGWRNLGILFASRQFVADHPILKEEHDGKTGHVGPDDPIGSAMFEALHGKPKPAYVDASDPEAAEAERQAAAAKKGAEAQAAAVVAAATHDAASAAGTVTHDGTVPQEPVNVTLPVPVTPVVETKHYSDGSSATGVAPLPDQSPAQQEAAAKAESENLAEAKPLTDTPQ